MNPNYTVNVPRKAQKQINQLPSTVQNRMIEALLSLGREPRPAEVRNLKLRVGHRRDVYR